MIKPIAGSWFEFQHSFPPEGPYWNPECMQFSEQQWEAKVRETAELGFEYLVLMSVALDAKSFYVSKNFPSYGLATPDAVEVVLNTADQCGLKFFVSNDFFGNWRDAKEILFDPQVIRRRMSAMEEISERFAQHPSFHGWYWPNEACIQGHFSEDFINYVNGCSAEARRLTPGKQTLIAPYGTNMVAADDDYARQLERLDVDIIAYQDEIGVRKTQVEELPKYWENLRRMHDRVPQRSLWADIEIFDFEGGVYESALIPAPFPRIQRQMQIASDYVDKILIYQYQGIMNPPDTAAYAGHKGSTALYNDYVEWLEREHPHLLARAGSNL